jgi:hypothetical protein
MYLGGGHKMSYSYPRFTKASFQVAGQSGKEDCLYRSQRRCSLLNNRCLYYNSKRKFLYFWRCNNFISKSIKEDTLKSYCKYSIKTIKNSKPYYSCLKLKTRCTLHPIKCIYFKNRLKSQ